MTKVFLLRAAVACAALSCLFPGSGFAQTGSCPRFGKGSTIVEPQNLFSEAGILQLNLTYMTGTDIDGNTVYCFVTSEGIQNPTLHVKPGDQLIINVTNGLPTPQSTTSMSAMPGMVMNGAPSTSCGAVVMDSASVNIHYHGTNVLPICHQDEVISTLINSGQSFQYDVHFPPDEPPGLYWYHPHVHGISEAAVMGGASGAIIVEGIENVIPAVAGLPTRVMVVRDNPVAGAPTSCAQCHASKVPFRNISLNYIPIPYPNYPTAVVPIKPLEKQLWRVLNASADTILDIQVQYDGKPQTLEVVALDGVPTGSRDGAGRGSAVSQTDILLAPAARAEFIVTGPALTVKTATLLTLAVNTGPDGNRDPQRPIATIKASVDAPDPPPLNAVSESPNPQRFAGLADAPVTTARTLYFSEVELDPGNPSGPTNFFITVAGQTPTLFNPNNPPAITTTQGSVEDWTIENHAKQNHEFHIHQIHFLVTAINGVPVSDGQYLDTINVPYWTGTGPYPSVTVRMDFRGRVVGDFVYHCHILLHEDNGMMAIIRVNPK